MKAQINTALFLAAILIFAIAYHSFQSVSIQRETLSLKEEELKIQKMIEQARLDMMPKTPYSIVHDAGGKTYLLDSITGATWILTNRIADKSELVRPGEAWEQIYFRDATLQHEFTNAADAANENAKGVPFNNVIQDRNFSNALNTQGVKQ